MRIGGMNKQLMLSVTLGIGSAILLYSHINGLERQIETRHSTIRILVARHDIPADSLISARMVMVKNIPRELVVDGAVNNLVQLRNKVNSSPILSGEQLSSKRLVNKNSLESTYIDIPSGMRAITVTPDDLTAPSGLLKSGDRVDLILTYDTTSSDINKPSFIENLKVARISTKAKDNDAMMAEDIQRMITLIVVQKQAETIAYADEYGKVKVALRPLHEELPKPKESGITIASLKETRDNNRAVSLNPVKRNNLPERSTSQRIKSTTRVETTPVRPPVMTAPKVETVNHDKEFTIEVIRGTESASVSIGK
jgi:pilus assembly protein CpaB